MVKRMIGPMSRAVGAGNRTQRVTSRIPRTCQDCRRTLPAGTPHIVWTSTPDYADELGYGKHWLTMRTCGESPRACLRTDRP